jgi:hypothetical protein
MPIVLFRGTVRPPVFKLNLTGLPTIRYGWPEQNLSVDFTVSVKESKLEVRCDATRFDPQEHLSMLAMHAYDLSRAAVDSFSFFHGIGLTVFLEIFVDPSGMATPLTPRSEEVLNLCTAFNLDPSHRGPDDYDAMIRLVVKDRHVLLALNDLVVSISQFNLASINCARAMEALRTAMTPEGANRAEGWPIMHRNLNVTKNYLSFISDVSRGPRHGDKRSPLEGQQAEILKRSWTVMNRFLEFRKRDNGPLPESEFQLLDR